MNKESGEKTPPISLPGWLSEKRALIAWIVSFAILIVLTFFIFIPIAVTMNDSDGNCFLYAHHYGFGPFSACSFCVAIGVIFLFMFALRLCFLIFKIREFSFRISEWFSIWGVHLIVFILDIILLILLLVAACLISSGFSQMCSNLFGGRSECSSEEGVLLPNYEPYTAFYDALSFAEGAAWFTFCYWLLIVALETFMLWKNGSLKEAASKVDSLIIHRNASDDAK